MREENLVEIGKVVAEDLPVPRAADVHDPLAADVALDLVGVDHLEELGADDQVREVVLHAPRERLAVHLIRRKMYAKIVDEIERL